MSSNNPIYAVGDTLKVTYSANNPELVGKIVKVVSHGSFIGNSYWYTCVYNGINYSLCEEQLWYKD